MKYRKIIFLIIIIVLNPEILFTASKNSEKEKIDYMQQYVKPVKPRKAGIGIDLGSVKGIDIKYYLNNTRCINIKVGSIEDRTEYDINHFWHFSDINIYPKLLPYFGLGGIICVGGTEIVRKQVGLNPGGQPKYENVEEPMEPSLRVSAVIGMKYNLKSFDFFLQLIPFSQLLPDIYNSYYVGLGVHFNF